LLKYKDTEGDLITIGCNDDFHEALLQQPKGQTLKINVVSSSPISFIPEKLSTSLSEIARGLGVALEEAYRGLTEEPKECKYNVEKKQNESKEKNPLVMEVDVDYSEALQMFNHNAVQHIRSGKLNEAEKVLLYTLKFFPNNPTLYYNLACVHSLRGDAERSVEALKKSFALGFDEIDTLENDSDFDQIRNFPSFQELIAENRESIPSLQQVVAEVPVVIEQNEPEPSKQPELFALVIEQEPPKIPEPEQIFPLLKLRPVEAFVPVVEEVPKKSEEEEAIEKALSQLVEMGFSDWEMNVRMLAKNNLDMMATVRDLLDIV